MPVSGHALMIRTPSRTAAQLLAGRLEFAEVSLEDGEVQECRVVVLDPSAVVFNRTLTAISDWLEECDLASVEVAFGGTSYVVDGDTPARLGISG